MSGASKPLPSFRGGGGQVSSDGMGGGGGGGVGCAWGGGQRGGRRDHLVMGARGRHAPVREAAHARSNAHIGGARVRPGVGIHGGATVRKGARGWQRRLTTWRGRLRGRVPAQVMGGGGVGGSGVDTADLSPVGTHPTPPPSGVSEHRDGRTRPAALAHCRGSSTLLYGRLRRRANGYGRTELPDFVGIGKLI